MFAIVNMINVHDVLVIRVAFGICMLAKTLLSMSVFVLSWYPCCRNQAVVGGSLQIYIMLLPSGPWFYSNYKSFLYICIHSLNDFRNYTCNIFTHYAVHVLPCVNYTVQHAPSIYFPVPIYQDILLSQLQCLKSAFFPLLTFYEYYDREDHRQIYHEMRHPKNP